MAQIGGNSTFSNDSNTFLSKCQGLEFDSSNILKLVSFFFFSPSASTFSFDTFEEISLDVCEPRWKNEVWLLTVQAKFSHTSCWLLSIDECVLAQNEGLPCDMHPHH